MVFGGEPSAFVREHFHALKKDVVGISMGWTVGDPRACWRRSAAGSSSRPSGRRSRTGSSPVAPPLVEASGCQEAVVEPVRRRRRRARNLDRVVALLAPLDGGAALAAVQNVLEHKFYFDELYNVVFYRPAVALSHGLAWLIEAPLRGRWAVRGVVRELGRRHEPHPDRARPPVRARDRGRRRRHRHRLRGGAMMSRAAHPRPGRRRAPPVADPVLALLDGRRSRFLISLVEVGLWIDMLVRFDFSGGIQFEAQRLVQRPASPTTSASTASRSGSPGSRSS